MSWNFLIFAFWHIIFSYSACYAIYFVKIAFWLETFTYSCFDPGFSPKLHFDLKLSHIHVYQRCYFSYSPTFVFYIGAIHMLYIYIYIYIHIFNLLFYKIYFSIAIKIIYIGKMNFVNLKISNQKLPNRAAMLLTQFLLI